MEFFNIFLFLVALYIFSKIGSYNSYLDRTKVVIDNAELLNFDNEQPNNEKYIKTIEGQIKGPGNLIETLGATKEYQKIVDNLKVIKDLTGMLASEQYALKKSISEFNKAPYELNVIQVGKYEFNIKEKGKALKDLIKIYSNQISTGWAGIVIIVILFIYLNILQGRF